MTDLDTYQTTLEQWLLQLEQGKPAPQLTYAAAVQLARQGNPGSQQLLQAIETISADDLAADAIDTWLEFSQIDESITSAKQPFHLSILQTLQWTRQVEAGIEQGRNWLQDSLGALCFGFSAILVPSTFAPATKSARSNAQLFRYEVARGEDQPWEVEVAGFVQDEAHFRLEVALLKPEEPQANLANVPITVVAGEVVVTQNSDLAGVALFSDLPIAEIDQILVRVAPQM